MNRITSHLAAHAGTRQVDAVLYADAAANAADKALVGLWNELFLQATLGRSTENLHRTAASLHWSAASFIPAAHEAIQRSFEKLVSWGHRSAAQNAVRSLPRTWLATLALRRLPTTRVSESRHFLEERESATGIAGLVKLFLSGGELAFEDTISRLREPSVGRPSAAEARELFQQILFPPPSADVVRGIVKRLQIGAETWEQRLSRAAHRFNPAAIADTIGAAYAAGKTQREIAQELLPAVDGLRVSAMRVARTYGMNIAHVTSQAVSHELGDLRVGDMVHATLDQNTRPLHRARTGTIYYFHPAPGQKDYGQCPQPPLEADGTVAWNCRCVTGNAIVHSDVRSITRSWYDGQAVEFRTRGGAMLTVTANHPIATTEGMVAASALHQGHYLLSDSIGVAKRTNAIEDRVATIQNVFEALAIRGDVLSLQRPYPLEFHGDGRFMYGQVHIVRADFRLMTNGNTTIAEGENEGDFIRRAPSAMRSSHLASTAAFTRARPLQELRRRTATNCYASFDEHSDYTETSAGIPSSPQDSTPRNAVGVRQRFKRFSPKISTDKIGRTFYALGNLNRFRFCTNTDPSLEQPSFHGSSLNSTVARDRVTTVSSQISFDQVIRRPLTIGLSRSLSPCANSDPTGDEFAANDLPRYSEFFDELAARHARVIAPDQIVYVRRFHLRSFVYSVDSGLGYYMGSDNNVSVVQGNCFLSAVLRPPAGFDARAQKWKLFTNAENELIPDPAVYSDWFQRADEKRRRLAVGTRRYSTAQEILGRDPAYEELVEPETGALIALNTLKAEAPEDRALRVQKVQREIASRRAAIRSVGTFGFVPPIA